MTKLEYVLDFAKEYGKQMLLSGSNIERVGLVMERICHAYGLHDVTATNFRWGTRSGVDLVAGDYTLGFFLDYEGRVGDKIPITQNFVSFGLSLGYSF